MEPSLELDYEAARRYANKSKVANDKGTEFTLPFDYVREMISHHKCAYTGIELSSQHGQPNYLTLERIDPLVGYIPSNTVTVSVSVNNMKGLTLDKFLHDPLMTDEQKLKLLRQVIYRLDKRIKADKAKQAELEANAPTPLMSLTQIFRGNHDSSTSSN